MPSVPDYFSKGLCGTYGADIPPQFAEDLRNVRVKNGVTVPRYGYKSVGAQSGAAVQAMAANNGKLYKVQGGHFWLVDPVAQTSTDLGAVGGTGPASCEVYGIYTVIFVDGGQPYVYDGTFLNPVTTYVTAASGAGDYPVGSTAINVKVGQTFTSVSSAFNWLTANAQVKKFGAPSDNLFANVYAVSAGIPLNLLSRKVAQVVEQRYGYRASDDPAVAAPIGSFRLDDGQEFIL